MSPEDFTVRLAALDGIETVPAGYVAGLYSSVQANPLQPMADHTDEVRARAQRLTHLPPGKDKPAQWAVPHRFFVKDYTVTLVENPDVPTPVQGR